MPAPKNERKPYLNHDEKEKIKNFLNSNGIVISKWANVYKSKTEALEVVLTLTSIEQELHSLKHIKEQAEE